MELINENRFHEQKLKKEFLKTQKDERKYLVVEDDFALQPIWEYVLQTIDPNAVIRWARTQEGAEKLINDRIRSKDQFDIIIADVMLAGKKTGVDLWRDFKETGMLFLFTSSLTEKKFQQMVGENYGEYPFFLRKPLYVPDCIACINALIAFKNLSLLNSSEQ